MTELLNVKDLRAYYGQVQALHGLSFSLNEGSLTTLLGANGAGKTTTLRAICNMVRSTGAIEFEGAPLTGRSTENIVRLGIAHVPQGRGTFTAMTVEENLQLGAITRKDNAGIVAEPSGAAATAAVLTGALDAAMVVDGPCGAVVSGGNISMESLAELRATGECKRCNPGSLDPPTPCSSRNS